MRVCGEKLHIRKKSVCFAMVAVTWDCGGWRDIWLVEGGGGLWLMYALRMVYPI